MQRYLVIGLYVAYNERYADVIEAATPDDAEAEAIAEHPDLTIAAVLNEEGQVVA
jgi:hypothetical protein